jgi:hypothetical protein
MSAIIRSQAPGRALGAIGLVVMKTPPIGGGAVLGSRLRGPMILEWFRRRQDGRRLAQADAEGSAPALTIAPRPKGSLVSASAT